MPDAVTEKARAKVNLALRVLGRRTDGYHELDSIVAFADVGDLVSIRTADGPSFTVTGPHASDVPQDGANLVTRASADLVSLYQTHGVMLPPLAISLEKNLPVASGIGGGSADAAAAIRAIIKFTGIDLPNAEVYAIALALGADVPVCLHNAACRMQGVGESILPMPHRLPPAIVLVNPRRALSTRDVFTELALQPGQRFNQPLDDENSESWDNDLLLPALKLMPEIETLLFALKASPNLSSVCMSGSGATCFGLAQSLADAEAVATQIASTQPRWWVSAATLG